MAASRGSAAYQSYVADLRSVEKESFEVQQDCSWWQVCTALCPPSGGGGKGDAHGSAKPGGASSLPSSAASVYTARAEVPIVDVMHLSADGSGMRQWFFTSRSGRISRKSKKNASFANIFATFQDIAKSYGTPKVAVVRRGRAANVIADDGLEMFRSACTGADSVSAFIPPKGSAGTANFRDAYTRTGAGASTLVTYRVGAPLGMLRKGKLTPPRSQLSASALSSPLSPTAAGSSLLTSNKVPLGRGETVSAATNINRVLNGYTAKVVRALENYYKCNVLSLSAVYVVDEDETAWLVHARDVRIGRNPSADVAAAAAATTRAPQRSSTAPHGAGGVSDQRHHQQFHDRNATTAAAEADGSAGATNSRSMKLTSSQQIRADNRRALAESLRHRPGAGTKGPRTSSLAPHELPQLAKQPPTGYRGASSYSSSVASPAGAAASSPSARRRGSRSGRLTALAPPHRRRANSGGSGSLGGGSSYGWASEDGGSYGGGGGGGSDDAGSVQSAALAQAQRALDALTKKDVTELRSYSKPPASVVLVTRAVMLLLTGHALDWVAAKRVMASSERFLLMLLSLDRDALPEARLRSLRPFMANPTFRPEFVEPTSVVAARFCSFVRGIYEYALAARGGGDDDDDDDDDDASHSEALMYARPSDGRGPTSRQQQQPASSGYGRGGGGSDGGGAGARRQPAPLLSRAKQGSLGYRNSAVDTRALRNQGRRSPPLPGALRLTAGRGAADVPVDPDVTEAAAAAAARARKEKAAKQKTRRQQLARLAKSGGDGGGSGLGETEGVQSFIAADGALMPYAVTGRPDTDLAVPAVVVLQDIFETFEKPRIFLHKLLRKHVGTQALFFNFPGQAYAEPGKTAEGGDGGDEGADGKPPQGPTLNNTYLAGLLHELLQKLERDGEFVTSCRPFYIVGFGNGGNVATCFTAAHGRAAEYSFTLKGLVLANSHAYLDSQLAAIYHSSLNVFACFPPDRPDLPVSYFSRFLFSDKYLSRVDKNLVLNIYTAISNPISNNGRAELCRGALAHADLRQALREGDVAVPLVLIQSTENSLVNAKHVDAYLEGRAAQHVWSHQQSACNGGKFSKGVERQVAALLGRTVQQQQEHWEAKLARRRARQRLADDDGLGDPDGDAGADADVAAGGTGASDAADAVVFWLPGGHEVCQESRDKMQSIFDVILGADARARKARGGGGPAAAKEKAALRRRQQLQQQQQQQRKPPKAVQQRQTALQATQPPPDGAAEAAAEARQALEVAQAKQRAADLKRREDPEAAEKDAVLGTLQLKIAERLDAFDTLKTEEAARRRSVVETELEKVRREQEARRSKWLAEDDRVVDGVAAEQAYSRQLLEKEGRRKEAAVAAAEQRMMRDAEGQKALLERQVAAATLPSPGHTLTHADMLELGFVFAPEGEGAGDDAAKSASAADSPHNEDKHQHAEGAAEGARRRQRRRQVFPHFDEEQLLRELRAELRLNENHVVSVASMRAAERRVDVRLSQEAARALWRKCREGALSSEAPEFATLVAANGDRLNRDGTLIPAAATVAAAEEEDEEGGDSGSGGGGGGGGADESVEGMFAQLAAEERKRETALAARRQLEQEEVARMEEVQAQLKAQHEEHQAIKQAKKDALRREQEAAAATMMQALVRGKLAQLQRKRHAELAEMDGVYTLATSKAQALIRRFLTRNWYLRTRAEMKEERLRRRLAQEAQRVVRGGLGRKRARAARAARAARVAQRVVRGRLGRVRWSTEKQRQLREQEEARRAAKIQSVWRMYKGQTVYQQLFMEDLAATAVQRVYRGLLARRRVAKQRQWDSTTPGAERLELGLKMISSSKEAFERQRQEIESLHRDQEQAESRVSLIHAGLRESERELEALEAELQGIDQLDQDLRELTHEKQLYDARIEKSGLLQQVASGGGGAAEGRAILSAEGALEAKKLQADAYALEMAIHMKRAEREKKKKVLESEFAAVMDEIGTKRGQLAKLEGAIQDMELTRQRKDREFARLQRDLMELLEEQKKELDHLREKGVELEVATATSAAAAKNTALTAKKHEQKTQAIFQGTEELLKFQFMSMSLGYFNSLNMLKSLRDMNSDTTSSAITTSAQTALAAATAASAAKIPTMKHLNLGAHDVIDAIGKEREQEARQREQRIREVQNALQADFPADVKDWNIEHIVQWLDTLMLGQYRKAFEEAAIDGMFLLELTDADLRDVLGVTHQLHRKKLLFSRDKLMPLSAAEIRARKEVHHEKLAGALRDSETTPNDTDTVFSLARNGRRRQVEDVLDKGFAVNTEDEFGNTLLIVGAQQVNLGLCEMLLKRQAHINRQNHQGNTALHYAMAYDPSGDLGEYLIAQGADDTLENKWGLTPYDGISQDDA